MAAVRQFLSDLPKAIAGIGVFALVAVACAVLGTRDRLLGKR